MSLHSNWWIVAGVYDRVAAFRLQRKQQNDFLHESVLAPEEIHATHHPL